MVCFTQSRAARYRPSEQRRLRCLEERNKKLTEEIKQMRLFLKWWTKEMGVKPPSQKTKLAAFRRRFDQCPEAT